MKPISILGKILLLICLSLELLANVTASLNKIAIYKGNSVILSIKASGSDIKFPNITSIAGFRVTSTSNSSQVSIINSKISKSEERGYTFVPTKTTTIKSFDIKIDGKIYKTKPLKIKVIKPQASKVGDDFVYKISLSKNKAYQGEAIHTILKFMYKVGSNPLDVNLEKFAPKHFWVKELSNPKPKEENGYIIQTINFLLFPQIEGEQTIDSQVINVAIRGGYGFVNWKKIISNKVDIKVLPLPKNINVQGSYNIEATVDKTNIKENEPVNLTIKVEGFGNIDDIEPFKLSLKDEVTYNSKPQFKSILKNNKYGGQFIQKISIIGNKDFTIPEIEFRYFDIKTKQIKSAKTKPIKIKVKSISKNTPQIEMKNKTIKPIVKKIIIKENSYLKYIYGIVGFLIGILVYYVFTIKNKEKIQLSIVSQIKKAKNDKDLYEILLPYSQNEDLKDIIKDLENNIYQNGTKKIDKKLLLYKF
jgi:hypothetical protein